MNKLFLVRDIIGLSLLPSPPFPPLRFRFASKIPLHLYPESPPKLHPNVQLNAPAPRIESRIFLLLKAQGDGASNFPHHLKVATPSVSVALSPFEGVRLAAGGAIASPSGGPGGLPPANLCLLSFRKKVGRGAGRSARSMGSAEGQRPSQKGPRACKGSKLHLVSLRSNPQLLLQPLHVSELAERQRHC